MSKRVLVVAAHPDDEVLGAGGAMAWHRKQGERVSVLVLGEGVGARYRTQAAARAKGRMAMARLGREMRLAHAKLGVARTIHRNFPDNRFDTVDRLDIIKAVEDAIAAARPEVVYTHHAGDLNIDHRIACEAVVTACRPTPGSPVKRLLSFEVASSTECAGGLFAPFVPTVFLDIGPMLKAKLDAMACYKSELRPFPHPRSLRAIRNQAEWRGAAAGVRAAEAFVMLLERV